MSKNKKFVPKPWDMVIQVIIPVIIILIANFKNASPDTLKQIYFLFGMIVSLFGVSYFLKIVIIYIKAGKWSTAEAVIIENKVNKIDDAESFLYEPGIKYKYTVGGAEYCSSNIYPYDKFNTSTIKSYTVVLVNKYPEGKIFKIFYNPLQPQESYIVRKGIFPVIIFLLMFISTFIIMMLASLGIITLQ